MLLFGHLNLLSVKTEHISQPSVYHPLNMHTLVKKKKEKKEVVFSAGKLLMFLDSAI